MSKSSIPPLKLINRSGYTLVETIIGLALSLVVLCGFYFFYNMTTQNIVSLKQKISLSGSKLHLRKQIESSCIQANTFQYPANQLSCLKDGTCSSTYQGPLKFIGEDGSVLIDPGVTRFTTDLLVCPDPAGDSWLCPYKIDSSFKIACAGTGCAQPDILVKLQFTKVDAAGVSQVIDAYENLLTPQRFYRSCAEAKSKGKTASGFYKLDPDGSGGVCPFEVYCRMGTGLAQALVVSAPLTGYSEIAKVDPPLGLDSPGRLDDKYVLALMSTSDFEKKISVLIKDTAQGSLTVPLVLANTNKGSHQANVGYCEWENTNFVASVLGDTTNWEFVSSIGGASIGYSESTNAGAVSGFHCQNCGTTGVCSLGGNSCCQKNLAGQLWIQ
ncbi:fibrinogen-like YCDxxxxGGGW domain-containing protein [Bdellovibrio sp. HCB337]|uniref:fibrinogen-like YCDxxxxGGGW domain-containing protein n=1 Tax=Bdellovibrio sp. HCB337 TaxID=3394358 RepID=UPI0039A6DD5E